MTRNVQPQKTKSIDMFKRNRKVRGGGIGFFGKIAAARGEYGKASKGGYVTPSEEQVGRGGSTTINVNLLGQMPTMTTGPARRRLKTGHKEGG